MSATAVIITLAVVGYLAVLALALSLARAAANADVDLDREAITRAINSELLAPAPPEEEVLTDGTR